jgi:hypothetical protein
MRATAEYLLFGEMTDLDLVLLIFSSDSVTAFSRLPAPARLWR